MVGAGARPSTRLPHCSRRPSTTWARARSRDPTITSWPAAASRVAIPRPAGPVPPNTPISIPRASHSHHHPEHLGVHGVMMRSTPRCSAVGITVVPGCESSSMSDSRLAPYARTQLGLVTRTQALTKLSPHTLDDWVRARRLEPVRRGVYRVAGTPASWRQSILAVCLAGGSTTYVSFRAAAALYEFEGFDAGALAVTQFGQRPSIIAGVEIHESAVFGPGHVTQRARSRSRRSRGRSATSPPSSGRGRSSARSTRHCDAEDRGAAPPRPRGGGPRRTGSPSVHRDARHPRPPCSRV